jgi:hypothetical protein
MEPLTSFGLGILAGFFLLAFVVLLRESIYKRQIEKENRKEYEFGDLFRKGLELESIHVANAKFSKFSDINAVLRQFNRETHIKISIYHAIHALISYLNVAYDEDKKQFVDIRETAIVNREQCSHPDTFAIYPDALGNLIQCKICGARKNNVGWNYGVSKEAMDERIRYEYEQRPDKMSIVGSVRDPLRKPARKKAVKK